MHNRQAKYLALAIALGSLISMSFWPGVTQEAFAFHGGGHGGGHAGGHFGHFGGHFGRHLGGHFGRRFGGIHAGRRLFGAQRFNAMHNGSFGHASAARAGIAGHNFAVARLAHFHGFHGLDPYGFNRNAFGRIGGWSRWARGNWGAGWNNWGSGWGYWAGPVFWPFLYGDALSFVLWPDDLYDPFFAYGPNYLLGSIFWPGPLSVGYAPMFDVYDYPPQAANYYGYYHRRHHRKSHASSAMDGHESCGGLAPGVADLPIDKIKKRIKPTDQQMNILDQLQVASAKADGILRAACPSDAPLTPVGRINAVDARLHAMVQAIAILRGPLTDLDSSLDDTQREKLAALGGRGRYRHAGVALSAAPAKDLAALCKKDTSSFTLLPVTRINDIVKPTAQQQPAFHALQSASKTAAQNLDSSCPYDVPETVPDRLKAVTKRLDALIEAVMIVKPALTRFYATLTDEQKARFNVIGGAGDTAGAT